MSCCALVKAGYGSLKEIQNLDTKDFLNCLEYEYINSSIESIIYEEAKNY